MNKEIAKGRKRQIHGQARQLWGALTNDKLMRLDGKFEKFVGVLQEKEGHTQEAAEAEINPPPEKPEAPSPADAAPAK